MAAIRRPLPSEERPVRIRSLLIGLTAGTSTLDATIDEVKSLFAHEGLIIG